MSHPPKVGSMLLNYTGTIQTSGGVLPVYDKVALENLDDQVAAVSSMPGGRPRTIEEMAINQIERGNGPKYGGKEGVSPGHRPGIQMMDKLAPSVVQRLGSKG